jgi:hypothetical protein
MKQIGNQVVPFLAFKFAGTPQCLPIVALGGMKPAEILANHSHLIPHRGALCVGPTTPQAFCRAKQILLSFCEPALRRKPYSGFRQAAGCGM